MKRPIAALLLVLALPLSVAACLWDRDTPSREAAGLPGVVAAITARFERNPPRYYEMRRDRLTAYLQAHPDDLSAHDDLAVACDRLGDGDQAIAWMEKKRTRIDMPQAEARQSKLREQRYRYHANLGTFLIHRWARRGADREQMADVKAARDQIAKAMEINPNAHFGRERYQLQAIDWILDPPPYPTEPYESVLPDMLEASRTQRLKPEEAHDAVRGLAGLILLGNAWESVDVFNSLIVALDRDRTNSPASPNQADGRTHLAHLARYRAEELIDDGRRSLHPAAPTGEDLKRDLHHSEGMQEPDLRKAFVLLRQEADAWHANRTAFMMSRLQQGRHPDTDPTFWNGYVDRPAPALPMDSQSARRARMATTSSRIAGAVVLTLVLLAVGGLVVLGRWRAPRRKPVSAPLDF